MKKIFSSVCLFLLCSRPLPAIGQEASASSTIAVIGEASVSIPADEIVIRVSIESLAKTPSEASKDNQEKSQRLVEFLKEMKISEQHIHVALLSIEMIPAQQSWVSGKGIKQTSKGIQPPITQVPQNPFGEGGELVDADSAPTRRADSYRAYRSFSIVIKDLGKIEEIYRGIVEQGINQIDGIEYRSSVESQRRDELRILAVRNAKNRAAAMANELGAKLDSIKSISNDEAHRARGVSHYGNPFGLDTSPEVRIEAQVSVVFSLRDTELKQ